MILIILLLVFLSIPAVQKYLAKQITTKINKDYNTNIVVKKVAISLLGNIDLKEIQIRDHHQDTLIFVKSFKTSLLSAKRILDKNLNLGDATITDGYFYMKKYKDESKDNLAVFIENFNTGKPKDTLNPFTLSATNIYVHNINYQFFNKNKKNALLFGAYNINGIAEDFSLIGTNVSVKARKVNFTDNRSVNVKSLATDFEYSSTQMKYLNTKLITGNASTIIGDAVMSYKLKDLSEFTDKVKIKATLKKSNVSVKDLSKIYGELSGNDNLFFTGKMKGTLNNFSVTNLNLNSRKGMRVIGNLDFINAVKTQRGFIFDANFKRVTSNYNQLKSILPNILGKSLPTHFEKLGDFSLKGIVKVTPDIMDATLTVYSKIGTTISDLQLTNISNINQANYNGDIEFIDLDIGQFTQNKNLGKVSLKADVSGKGFKIDDINTRFVGTISKLDFKGYSYQNLIVNGEFQNKKFDGFLDAKDENVKLNFQGLADFSSDTHKFDFSTDIEKIDLKKTKLFKRDSIAELKGQIKLDVTGNTLDNIIGKARFSNLTYKNSNRKFEFKDFEINSSLVDSIKTIKVNSKDIVNGELKGKFTFSELLPVCQNALGSVYTNYKPIPVASNQFINFDFTIHNQIVNLFLPDVSISKNTKIKGKINANKNAVKLNFSSPNLDVYKNSIDNVKLRLDNKNDIYNTHLTALKIKNKYYEINKVNLINKTVNDTLFFKTVFQGPKLEKQNFNLNFFYTIDTLQKSVLGLQKSTFKHNNFDWTVNPLEDKKNKIMYSLADKSFNFSPFLLTSNEQKIEFYGDVKGNDFKDLKTKFTNFEVANLLPDMESLKLSGSVNGIAELKESLGKIQPKANLTVSNILVNDLSQGELKINVEGQNSLNKYNLDIAIKDYEFDNVKAVGSLDFSSKKPTMDLDVKFKEYELNSFSDFGGKVLSNIRGRLSGNIKATGEIINPDFNGSLKLDDAGLTFPYLNIDFDLVENSNIRLKNKSFIINNLILQDTKFDTQGIMSGDISHQELKKWALDLRVDTNNLLVLDTKEVESIPYYGRGFLKGNASIYGYTSNLNINVRGSTEPETVFVIPLDDVTTIDNYKLIHFKTEDEKENKEFQLEKIKGLNLKIDLEVTKDAIAQVVIDKVSGSDLKGSGNGNLQIEIDTRGKFTMFGDLAIDNGSYNFKFGGIINKPFSVQKGGTISWDGNPFDADLDLTAVYKTKANPAQLLDNINSSRKIDIDLYTKITGGLFDSQQEFDIVIPNANSTVASELEFKLNENDINSKMQHFTFLLAFGTFYDEETIGNSASSGLTGTAAQLASSILSNVINTKDSKFELGLGYTQGDNTDIEEITNTDNQLDVSVSTKLTDRVLVNGSLGVPVGVETQASVVGEVKVEILLNEEGTFRANVFNKPNDIQYSLEEEGYTQGVGLSYQVNFDNLKELKEKILRKKKEENKKDSILVKNNTLINFRKKDSTATTNEKDN